MSGWTPGGAGGWLLTGGFRKPRVGIVQLNRVTAAIAVNLPGHC